MLTYDINKLHPCKTTQTITTDVSRNPPSSERRVKKKKKNTKNAN